MRNAFIVSVALLLVGTLGGGYTAYRLGTQPEEQTTQTSEAPTTEAQESPIAQMNNDAVNTDAGASGASGDTTTAVEPQNGNSDQAANLAPNESTTIPDPNAAGRPGKNPDTADTQGNGASGSGNGMAVSGGAAAGNGGSADNVPAAAQNDASGQGSTLPNGSNQPAGQASASQGAFVQSKELPSGKSPTLNTANPTSATNPSGDQPAPGATSAGSDASSSNAGSDSMNSSGSSAAGDTQANAASTAGSGDAAGGKLLFTGAKNPAVNCAVCHGAGGKGGVGANLTTADGPKSWDETQFMAALRQGQAPDHTLNATMPRFTKEQLSDGDINDIHAFIKTLP
ncbi:c-type cytochrome [Deinococcus irradiatisoli]|uniref:c-type cytochrome n=1 Tax=Deinococcus irradiatisoli TaxID=2202254 RepID=UPI0011B27394|nr:c-type cytochrome [Deinococcus irradiatisoli]